MCMCIQIQRVNIHKYLDFESSIIEIIFFILQKREGFGEGKIGMDI